MIAGHTDTPHAIHPVVISHPGSGRKALYVNPAFDYQGHHRLMHRIALAGEPLH